MKTKASKTLRKFNPAFAELRPLAELTPAAMVLYRDRILELTPAKDEESEPKSFADVDMSGLLATPGMTESLPEVTALGAQATLLDPTRSFESNFAFAEYVAPALKPVIQSRGATRTFENSGINAYLGALYMPQLTIQSDGTHRVKVVESYILGSSILAETPVSRAQAKLRALRARNYRNKTGTVLLLHYQYQDYPEMLREVLGGPAGKVSDVLDAMMQKPTTMFSAACWLLITAAFYAGDGKGELYQLNQSAEKVPPNTPAAKEAMRSLLDFVYGSCTFTHDVVDMSPRQLIDLLDGRTRTLQFWIDRAKRRLPLYEAKAEVATSLAA